MDILTGKKVIFKTGSETHTGVILLVYADAVASGTKDYVPITLLLVEGEGGQTYTCKPINVTKILKA